MVLTGLQLQHPSLQMVVMKLMEQLLVVISIIHLQTQVLLQLLLVQQMQKY